MTAGAVLAQAGGGAQLAETILFWVLSVVAIGGALAMITMRNVVHGALMLVMTMGAIAGLFLALETSFLAIIQIIIYGGAIMVLFLFVIMLLGVSRDDALFEDNRWAVAGAWLLGLLVVAATAFVFVGSYTGAASVCGQGGQAATGDGVRCIGLADEIDAAGGTVRLAADRLFTRYTFAFEFISLLLTIGVVGTLIIGRRRDLERREGRIPAELAEASQRGVDERSTAEPHGTPAGAPAEGRSAGGPA